MKNSKSKAIVFLNGKFMSANEARVSVLGPGFLCGLGLFETMRSYSNKIVYFDQHLERIQRSCKLIAMEFPYTITELKEIVRETVKINGFTDVYVRLTLWKALRGTDALVIAKKYQPYPAQAYQKGIRVTISRFKQNENSFLARIKTMNRLLYELSYREAKDKGFEGVIILNNRGYITEGSRSNIFFVKNETIFTPSLSCGCLDGITRRVIFDLAAKYHLEIYEGNFTLRDLYQADEVFFTNSLAAIMPAAAIEKYKIGRGTAAFKLTKFLMHKYHSLLKNGT